MFAIRIPCFDLNKIYFSGEVDKSSMVRLCADKYVFVHCDKAIKVSQNLKQNMILFSCNEEDFYNIWYGYFDIATDYEPIFNQQEIKIDFARGVRVLNIAYYQRAIQIALNSFGFNKIFREAFGIKHEQSFGELKKTTWYSFPNPDDVVENYHKLYEVFDKETAKKILSVSIAFSTGGEFHIFWKDNSIYDVRNICIDSMQFSEKQADDFVEYVMHFENKEKLLKKTALNLMKSGVMKNGHSITNEEKRN